MLNHFVICRLIKAQYSIYRRRPWQCQLVPLPIRRVQDRARWDAIRSDWPSLSGNLISSHRCALSKISTDSDPYFAEVDSYVFQSGSTIA